MTIKITPNDKGNPPGKLADAELHFNGVGDLRSWLSKYMDTCADPNAFGPLMTLLAHLGALDGLKLIGFSIWERRGSKDRNVTFPARSYVINGDRRAFALLRPIVDATAQARVCELVLEAFSEYEEHASV